MTRKDYTIIHVNPLIKSQIREYKEKHMPNSSWNEFFTFILEGLDWKELEKSNIQRLEYLSRDGWQDEDQEITPQSLKAEDMQEYGP